MKTLADIKRRACRGAALTMTYHSWFPNGKLIGLLRVVSKTQGNAIVLAQPDWTPNRSGASSRAATTKTR